MSWSVADKVEELGANVCLPQTPVDTTMPGSQHSPWLCHHKKRKHTTDKLKYNRKMLCVKKNSSTVMIVWMSPSELTTLNLILNCKSSSGRHGCAYGFLGVNWRQTRAFDGIGVPAGQLSLAQDIKSLKEIYWDTWATL